ncbi:transcobalamin-2-like [Sinocyclocheilus rhinocerous]|uniref:Transcobalamin-2-like n=1 Tax=Sinocyclocheilus rhinocerous TaxID=307959 RepID=A0A673GQJ7_9TELE|nr:PREDICTED: transcobalamin-2-like [Sinocyclocheilus rhinocerous]
MITLVIVSALLLALAAGKPCASDHEALLLSLNKQLLRSVDTQDTLPNPSVHIALRLSTYHNLAKESEYLNRLKAEFHDDIEKSLRNNELVVGRLALYILALKSSCHDLESVRLTHNKIKESLLIHLKKEMEEEKQNIAFGHRPKTNYYQYSLGILALCVSGVRVSTHVSQKLIHAVEHRQIKHGESLCVDSHAMAGMALQCLKDEGTAVKNTAELDRALATIKQRLLDSKRTDGHMGNEFSTGLAVQALMAMGSQMEECGSAMEALRADVMKGTYHNPMAVSQVLPALHQRTYLQLKSQECCNEDDTLTIDADSASEVLPSHGQVSLQVEVIKSNGASSVFSIHVPTGSSLFEALNLLQDKQTGFTFSTEDSLWGPFLSVVNEEQARQTDRRYWHISSDGNSLKQGIKDYKIDSAQNITIKNTGY